MMMKKRARKRTKSYFLFLLARPINYLYHS